MKRHPALVPLSHDHQHGLAAALRLKRAAEAWRDDADETALGEAARLFLAFARRELLAHFEEEEQALAPLLTADEGTLSDGAARLGLEHAELRSGFAALEEAAAGDDAAQLADQSARVASLLHDHVRWEERDLFEQMQRSLSEGQLDDLGLPPREAARQLPTGVHVLNLREPGARDGLAGTELNVTPVDLAAGEVREAWTADREVLVVVLRGDVTVGIEGGHLTLAAPGAMLIPGGVERTITAGVRGALLLTSHKARAPLSL